MVPEFGKTKNPWSPIDNLRKWSISRDKTEEVNIERVFQFSETHLVLLVIVRPLC
jgi:hypothetical protein